MARRNEGTGVWRSGTVAALGAATTNLVIYGLARAVDVRFVVPGFGESEQPMRIPPGQVVFVTFLMLLIGTTLAVIAARRGKVHLVQRLGVAFALLSLGAPLSLDAPMSIKLVLALMHLVAGAAFVLALRGVTSDGQVAARASATASPVAS